uniref:hypothetical protein n=1 Tax=Escherichia coli TaxID=562 RepID=UPI002B24ED0D
NVVVMLGIDGVDVMKIDRKRVLVTQQHTIWGSSCGFFLPAENGIGNCFLSRGHGEFYKRQNQ